MFENLTDKLERSFKILKGEGKITEINVAETLKEIRRALIDAKFICKFRYSGAFVMGKIFHNRQPTVQ